MDVIELEARTDFRSERVDIGRVYFSPLGPDAVAAVDEIWDRLTGGAEGENAWIDFRGRKIAIPLCVPGIARFRFQDLCERPLAAADYLKIAGQYHTIMLEGVPLLGPEKRNEAKRFIHLVDALYDNHIRFVVSAAAEPQALYRGGEGTEAFEFRRTVSRLMEMRSAEYLAVPQNPSAGLP